MNRRRPNIDHGAIPRSRGLVAPPASTQTAPQPPTAKVYPCEVPVLGEEGHTVPERYSLFREAIAMEIAAAIEALHPEGKYKRNRMEALATP